MDDAALVRRLERFRDLAGDSEGLVDRQRSGSDPLGQGRTLDQLEHQRRRAAAQIESVDLPDVRVVQRGQRFGFPSKPRKPVSVTGD